MSKNHPYHIFRKELGEEFRRLREEKGWTRQQASEFLNLQGDNVLENVERGRNKRFFLMFHLATKYDKKISVCLTDLSDADRELLQKKEGSDA